MVHFEITDFPLPGTQKKAQHDCKRAGESSISLPLRKRRNESISQHEHSLPQEVRVKTLLCRLNLQENDFM